MNWIGMVAVLFDCFPIYGSAEKVSGNPTVGTRPQPMLEPKVEDTAVDPRIALRAGSETER